MDAELPEPIHRYLTERVAQAFAGRDTVPEVARSMPLATVTLVVGGGPFGWLLNARLDDVDGRLVLEVLEDDRMSGPGHYRVWDDGTRESLPTEATGYMLPKDYTPEDEERVKEEFYLRNREIQEQLRERGFM